MAASAVPAVPRFVRIFFVRHGQSANNVLMRKSYEAYLEGRVADPPLTIGGRRQANATGAYFARMAEGGTGPEHVIVSPMLRTLETARPILAATGALERGKAIAWGGVCESGGIFFDKPPAAERPCHELTRDKVEAAVPGIACHDGITERGWWALGRKESKDESTARIMATCRVMRGWADAGRVEVPSSADFEALQGRMAARVAALHAGEDPDREAHGADPEGAGDVDADVGPAKPVPSKGGEENHPGPVASAAVVCHHDFIDRSIALLTSGDDPRPHGPLLGPEPTVHFCFNNCSVTVVDLYPGGTTRVIRLNDVRHLDPAYAGRRGLLSGFWQDVIKSPPEEWDGDDDDELAGPGGAPAAP